MEEQELDQVKPRINFQKHALPKISRSYALKFLFYIIMLVVLLFLIWYRNSTLEEKPKQREKPVDEIENITIEPSSLP